jgi:hypothetical protein
MGNEAKRADNIIFKGLIDKLKIDIYCSLHVMYFYGRYHSKGSEYPKRPQKSQVAWASADNLRQISGHQDREIYN